MSFALAAGHARQGTGTGRVSSSNQFSNDDLSSGGLGVRRRLVLDHQESSAVRSDVPGVEYREVRRASGISWGGAWRGAFYLGYCLKNYVYSKFKKNINGPVRPYSRKKARQYLGKFSIVRLFSEKLILLPTHIGLAHQGDHDYFGEMIQQMERGGREAMLYELLHHDYSDINLREPPATDALMEQKLLSLAPHEQWWFEKLTDGRLLESDGEWRTQVTRQELTADYADFVGRKDRGTATQLGIRLKSLLPAGFPRTGQRMVEQTPTGVQLRRRCWMLPSLDVCRARWDQRTRTKNVWPEEPEANDAHPSEPVEVRV